MNFESPDVAKDFPGLYASQTSNANDEFSDEEKQTRKKEFGWKKELKKERKDKGYTMFEEEDSEEELVMSEDPRSPSKMKKHSKPSFKFSKKDKFYKPKEKDKEEKREKKEKERREKEEKERREREDKEHREREEEYKKKEHKKKEKEEKLRFKKKKIAARAKNNAGDPDQSPIFGVALTVAVARNKCHDGIQLPAVFRDCIDYIEESGLSCEGIYRISGVKSKVQALKEAYNRGLPVNLHENEPNIVASLLKQFLRELPEPVLTTELLAKFELASGLKNVMQTVKQFQALIEQLPVPNKLLLSWTIVHMTRVIANEKKNKMSLQNVSIVLSPTLQISHRLLNIFFTHSKILFRDTVIKRHVLPLRPVTSRWSLELPDSPSSLEEELRKQESLLTQLHQELVGVKDSEKEDKLWEVQRVVTQLKRKLKNTKKVQEVTVAAVKREAEMEKKMERDEPKKTTGEKVENQLRQDKSVPQTTEVVVKGQNVAEESLVVTVTHGDTVDSGDKVEIKAEPPRMTKLKVKPASESKSPESDSKDVVSDLDRHRKDETKSEGSEHGKDTGDVKELAGDADGKQGREDREGTVGDKKETVGDREEMVSDRGDREEVVGDKEETVAGVTKHTDDVTSSEAAEVDKQQEAVKEKEGGRDEGRSRELEREYMALMLEEEELIATGDELRQKIATERSEMKRLEQEIADLQVIHEGLYDSDELWSESSDESLDEEELQETLQQLIKENQELERDNEVLCSKIPEERQICLDVKVQIRMIQQWQHGPSGMMDPLVEREL